MGSNVDLSIAAIEAAGNVLSRYLAPTPLLRDPLSQRRSTIWVKAESLQPTGSFKIRGATFRLSALSCAEREAGVIAYSTGNHAQAVAKAARDAGVKATIVMSADVPRLKVAATERWGATVIMAEANSHARRALAEELTSRYGYVLIPPYDDLGIMAGQGTIGLELSNQLPSLDGVTIYVPIGGGGLLAGVAAAIKQKAPKAKVVGVEPELEDDAYRSFRHGVIVAGERPSESIADAIKVQALGQLTFPIIQRYVDDIELVSEAEIVAATLMAFGELHLVVEPGGAVAYAAALRASRKESGPSVALLCGGNVGLERLAGLRAMPKT